MRSGYTLEIFTVSSHLSISGRMVAELCAQLRDTAIGNSLPIT